MERGRSFFVDLPIANSADQVIRLDLGFAGDPNCKECTISKLTAKGDELLGKAKLDLPNDRPIAVEFAVSDSRAEILVDGKPALKVEIHESLAGKIRVGLNATSLRLFSLAVLPPTGTVGKTTS